MAIWYQPPGPYIGGKQPYDPGRKAPIPSEGAPVPHAQAVLYSIIRSWDPPPPQPTQLVRYVPIPSESAPNPGSNARFYELVRAWDAPPPQPTQLVRYFPVPSESRPPTRQPWFPDAARWPPLTWGTQSAPFTPQVSATTTAFVPGPNTWLSGILSSWQPVAPTAQFYPKAPIPSESAPVGVPRYAQGSANWQAQFQYPQVAPFTPQVTATTAAQVPFTQAWLSPVLSAWVPSVPFTFVLPTSPIPSKSAPPPVTWTLLNQLVNAWIPPPPQPTQLHQVIVTGAATDDPPFPGINYQNTLIQLWQPGPPQPTQLVQNVVQEGPPTPPTPPTPPVGGPPQFGGGPFWREYGYDSAYDAIRNQTSTQAGPARSEPAAPPPFQPKPIDYHFIQNRAFGSVAADMRAFWEAELGDQRRALDEEEEEIILILSMLDS